MIYTLKNKRKYYNIKKSYIEGTLVLILFLILTIFLSYYNYYHYIEDYKNTEIHFPEWANNNFLVVSLNIYLLFAVIFMTFLIFKAAKRIVGKLVSNETTDNGIKLMTFEFEELDNRKIVCFTKENNSFVVDKKYILSIKEMSWVVKSIEDFVETRDSINLSNIDKIFNKPNSQIIFFSILTCFVMLFFIFCAVFILYSYPNRTISFIYILEIIILSYLIYKLINYIKKATS